MWPWLTMSHMRGVALIAFVLLLSGCARYREAARQRAPQAMRLSPLVQQRSSPSRTEQTQVPGDNSLVASGQANEPVREFGSWQALSRRQHLRPLQLSDGRLKQHPVIQAARAAHPPLLAGQSDPRGPTARVELLPPPPVVDGALAPVGAFGNIQQTGQTGQTGSQVLRAVHEQAASERTDIVQQALLERARLSWQAVDTLASPQAIPPVGAIPSVGQWSDSEWRGISEPGPLRPQAGGDH